MGTIWNALIAKNQRSRHTNPAISKLEILLRDNSAGPSAQLAAAELLAKRMELRNQLVALPNVRGYYVAALLNYVVETYYAGHSECLMLIVDNVDPYSTIVQMCVRKALQPLFSLSRVRVVISLRHTTERQVFNATHSSYTVDSVDYKGAKPMDVIRWRAGDAVARGAEVLKMVPEEPRAKVLGFLKALHDNHLSKERDRVAFLLQHLSGASVRKGLLYAQGLLLNSVYDPSTRSAAQISDGDMMRALIVRGSPSYHDVEGQMTCNLFQVANRKESISFLKLRALRAVKVRGQMTVDELVRFLQLFGYSEASMLEALNELISSTKRLLWSDALQRFTSISDLLTHGDTHLMLSEAGTSYQSYLYHRIEYLQEVILDCYIPSSLLGPGWRFGTIGDRFALIAAVLEIMVDVEIAEVERLVLPSDVLRELSDGEPFFTAKMCASAAHSAERIFGRAVRAGGGSLGQVADEFASSMQRLSERIVAKRESGFPDDAVESAPVSRSSEQP